MRLALLGYMLDVDSTISKDITNPDIFGQYKDLFLEIKKQTEIIKSKISRADVLSSIDMQTKNSIELVNKTVRIGNAEEATRVLRNLRISYLKETFSERFQDASTFSSVLETIDDVRDAVLRYMPKDTRVRSMGGLIEEVSPKLKSGANIIKFKKPYMKDFAGGLTRGEVTSIGARPGNGKTSFMLDITKELIEEGYKVLVINREMTNISTISKIYSMESNNLWNTDFRQEVMPDRAKSEIDRLTPKISMKYQNLLLVEEDLTINETINLVREHKPDVVCDDYLQIVMQEEGVKDENMRHEIGRILNKYKTVAKEVMCSIIAISQLSRDIEKRVNKEPQMSDFGESAVFEHISENCIFLVYPKQNGDDEDGFKTTVYVKKARYGKPGAYMIGFNPANSRYFSTESEARADYFKVERNINGQAIR